MRLEVAACLGMAKLSMSLGALRCDGRRGLPLSEPACDGTVAEGPPDDQLPPGGPNVVPAVFNAATVDPIHNPENSSATVEIASPSCLATATALPTSAGPVMAETDDLVPAAALCAAMDDRDDSASLLVNTPLRVLADNGAVAACGPLEVTEPTITTEAAQLGPHAKPSPSPEPSLGCQASTARGSAPDAPTR